MWGFMHLGSIERRFPSVRLLLARYTYLRRNPCTVSHGRMTFYYGSNGTVTKLKGLSAAFYLVTTPKPQISSANFEPMPTNLAQFGWRLGASTDVVRDSSPQRDHALLGLPD